MTILMVAALAGTSSCSAADRRPECRETTVMHAGDQNSSGRSLCVVAHRGGAALGEENTLTCISRAMDAGASWIEIDVHLSSDGEIVVCHDPTVDRTTDGTGYISSMEYSRIRGLNVTGARGEATGEHLPTLDEVLGLIEGRASLLLEIKHSKHSLPGIEKACIDCIRRHGAQDRVTIQSFDDDVLEAVHGMAPEIRLEKLLFTASPWLDFDRLPYVRSYNVLYLTVTSRFVRRAHEHGKEVKVWTLDKFKKRIVCMVDGVITNDPRIFM